MEFLLAYFCFCFVVVRYDHLTLVDHGLIFNAQFKQRTRIFFE